MCIFCFLDNLHQNNLRKEIQLRSDRFEHTLTKYKFAYIEKFYFSLDKDLCKIHNSSTNTALKNNLSKIKRNDLSDFFDRLISCYLDCIDSQLSEAQKTLRSTLKKYKILDLYKNLNSEILFRGRPSENFLSHWDMFHIPFNRRFLISNQRYSLVGQPLLYLSTSPYCIYKELNSVDNVQISSFRLNKYPRTLSCDDTIKSTCSQNYRCIEPTEFKCFNNINHFYEYVTRNSNITSYRAQFINSQSNLLDDKENKIDKSISSEIYKINLTEFIKPISLKQVEVKKILFHHILFNCTSFKKSNKDSNSKFCEEYVIPQLLAQLLKHEKFQGIIYTSTNAYDDIELCEKNPDVYKYLFKNICLFTNYNKEQSSDVTYVYDKKLYYNFLISSTIKKEDLPKDINYLKDSLRTLKKIIEHTYSTEELISECDSLTFSEIEKYLKLYEDIIHENNDLLISSTILHTFLLRNIILDIKDSLLKSKLSQEES